MKARAGRAPAIPRIRTNVSLLPPQHRAVVRLARKMGTSFNALVEQALSELLKKNGAASD